MKRALILLAALVLCAGPAWAGGIPYYTIGPGGTYSWAAQYVDGLYPDAADGAALGSTTYEWSDLYLADGGVVYFGLDQDVSLTHVADTGLTLYPTLTVTGGNAAGGSANALTVSGTLGIMDGSDTWNGLNIAPTNADHEGTGNKINAINIATITGDGQASEVAMRIGGGYDYDLYKTVGSLSVYGGTSMSFLSDSTTSFRSASETDPAAQFLHNVDFVGARVFRFAPADSSIELTGTGSQSFLSVIPEIDVSTRTGSAVINHLVIGDATGGGYTGTPATQALTLQGATVTSTYPVLTSDDTANGYVWQPTNSANHTGGTLTGFLANPSAVDADTTTYLFRGAVGSVNKWHVKGGGLETHVPQTYTVADSGADADHATQTVLPTSSVVEITCNDDDGCTIPLDETGAVPGQVVTLLCLGPYHCDFADTPGLTEIAGAFEAGPLDNIVLRYTASTFYEVSRSNN